MAFSACLICRHARKPKASGLGRVQCVISGEFVECMHVCGGFDSFYDRAAENSPSPYNNRGTSLNLRQNEISERP